MPATLTVHRDGLINLNAKATRLMHRQHVEVDLLPQPLPANPGDSTAAPAAAIAAGDRALQWLAQYLNMEPTHLRGMLWGLCLLLAGGWLVLS
jgi:hypothetical protein